MRAVVKKLINYMNKIFNIRRKILYFLMFFRFPKYCLNDIFIHPFSYISKNVSVEKGTNINGPCFLTSNVKIGKYCAIGYHLRVRVDSHKMEYANILGKLQKRYKWKSILYFKAFTNIGSNCWIGDNVIILGNINIGNGAIIGAGSIITKDVPAYAVVAGNPAKIIKYRFQKNIIDELEEICWWDWDYAKIKKNSKFFNTDLSQYEGSIKDLVV